MATTGTLEQVSSSKHYEGTLTKYKFKVSCGLEHILTANSESYPDHTHILLDASFAHSPLSLVT